MKLGKKALIGMMALCLGGTIATTFALTGKAGTANTTGNVDSAIYLNWNESSCTIDDITKLTALKTEYRQVAVAAPAKSTSVNKVGQLTFTLAASDEDHVIDGITVRISPDVDLESAEAGSAAWTDTTLLSSTNTTASYKFSKETVFYLAIIKVNDEHSDTAGAELTMSMSVVDPDVVA